MKKKRILTKFLIVVVVLVVVFLIVRSTWVEEHSWDPREAFLYGTIGTEVIPLPVFHVLPDMFPDQFQPAGPQAGDWMQQFGFIKGSPDVNEGLPYGFSVSNYLPQSGSPSPVKFVGLTCSACHTSLLRRSESDPGKLIYGMGSMSIDFFGWADALRTAIRDEERLTVSTIEDAYEKKFGESLGILEKITIRFWLSGIRENLVATFPKYDEPYSGKDLRNSALMPIGPGRSQSFRSLVQIALDRPGATDRAYSKLPAIYQQRTKEWSQFDGSAKNFVLRSTLASLGSGSTLETLALPEVLDNLKKASDFTLDVQGPRYQDVFPDLPIDFERAGRGLAVYRQHCASCHGYRGDDGQWQKGERQGEIVLLDEVKTDRERVTFRYYDAIGKAIYDYFPDDHPLNPQGDDLRQQGNVGFLNAPMDSMFTRVPFLHNGSVPTLAELINLKPRRAVFYRGSSFYDPVDLGLLSPNAPDDRHYYRFDTTEKGNSNKGHDYPWPYKGPGWDENVLRDLLEYLKTQ